MFKSDLMRTFRQLKESRAESVSEDVEIIYKRRIEDLCHRIRNYDRDRENILLDLSPSSLTSGAVVPSDFDATKFMEKDVEIGLNKRDAIIQLEIVLDRYEYLFGPLADTTAVLKVLPEYLIKFGFPEIMKKIMDEGIEHPQVCFLGIGDHYTDIAPIQVGQFESSDELLDKWLKIIWLEGHGGGNGGESYSGVFEYGQKFGKNAIVGAIEPKKVLEAITSHLDIPFDNVYYNDSIESNIKQML